MLTSKKSQRKLIKQRDRLLPFADSSGLQRMLRQRCQLRIDDFDEKFDYEYTDDKSLKLAGVERGGESYLPPKGFSKLGLNLEKRFPLSNGKWLRRENGWPIVYHGAQGRPCVIRGIIREGLKIRGGKGVAANGEAYGEGIYCSPDPEYAVRYARKHALETPDGDEFLIVFQCRVKPGKFEKESQEIWRVEKPQHIRPYAVLISDEV